MGAGAVRLVLVDVAGIEGGVCIEPDVRAQGEADSFHDVGMSHLAAEEGRIARVAYGILQRQAMAHQVEGLAPEGVGRRACLHLGQPVPAPRLVEVGTDGPHTPRRGHGHVGSPVVAPDARTAGGGVIVELDPVDTCAQGQPFTGGISDVSVEVPEEEVGIVAAGAELGLCRYAPSAVDRLDEREVRPHARLARPGNRVAYGHA